MTRTLSTCGRCAGTIRREPTAVAGWAHATETARTADGHLPDPDDSAVAGPDRRDCCDALADDPCDDGCDCDECENERALDDDAAAYFDREV